MKFFNIIGVLGLIVSSTGSAALGNDSLEAARLESSDRIQACAESAGSDSTALQLCLRGSEVAKELTPSKLRECGLTAASGLYIGCLSQATQGKLQFVGQPNPQSGVFEYRGVTYDCRNSPNCKVYQIKLNF